MPIPGGNEKFPGIRAKFPVFYPVTREPRTETGSLVTPSSSGESAANLASSAGGVVHSAVAHHHHALQLEALLQLVDLRRLRHRIGGGICPRTPRPPPAAVGRAHQANDNLRPVTTVVAAVAMFKIAAPAKAGVDFRAVFTQPRTRTREG